MTFKKYTLLVAVVFLASIATTSCDDDEGGGPVTFDGTIAELISDDQYKQSVNGDPLKSFDSLAKYLNKYPSLVGVVSASSDVTLFAPNNTAFVNLLATPNFPQNIALINPAIIEGVLSYHLVSGENLKASLTSGVSLTTMYPAATADDKIIVNSNGTLKTGSLNQEVDITTPDLMASNGVVHIVESVMIPQSVGASLTPILGTMAGAILLGKDFSNLAKVITAADAGFTEDATTFKFKLSTWLAMPVTSSSKQTANLKGFTFLAPPNKAGATDVMTEALANTLIASPDKGRSFVLNHLITAGQYTVADAPANNPSGITKFANGQTLTPLSGTTKNITVSVTTPSASNPFGVALSNTPGTVSSFRPIVAKDLQYSNGYIQVFAGGLQ